MSDWPLSSMAVVETTAAPAVSPVSSLLSVYTGGSLQPTAGVLQKLNERVHAGPGYKQCTTPNLETSVRF